MYPFLPQVAVLSLGVPQGVSKGSRQQEAGDGAAVVARELRVWGGQALWGRGQQVAGGLRQGARGAV